VPKSKTQPKVRCVVCHCLVPKSHVVDVYADPVCRDCDEEMVEHDDEQYEREVQREIDRVWGYGQ